MRATARLPLTAALLLASACAPGTAETVDSTTDSGGRSSVVRARRADGRAAWAHRIDGEVYSIFSGEIFPGGTQTIVQTGTAGGSDQGSVLVFDEDGVLRWRYRVCGETPAGHRLLTPSSTPFRAHVLDGRRFVVLPTSGLWAPYSVEVLEIDPDRGFVPRFRFWNVGVFSPPVVADGWIAFRCLNNSRRPAGEDRSYPIAIGVLSVAHALGAPGDGEPRSGMAPWRGDDDAGGAPTDHAGHGHLRYFLLDEWEVSGRHIPFRISIREGRVIAESEDGITYALDPLTGDVSIRASDEFRDDYERRAATEPDLESFETYVERLRGRVVSIAPDAR